MANPETDSGQTRLRAAVSSQLSVAPKTAWARLMPPVRHSAFSPERVRGPPSSSPPEAAKASAFVETRRRDTFRLRRDFRLRQGFGETRRRDTAADQHVERLAVCYEPPEGAPIFRLPCYGRGLQFVANSERRAVIWTTSKPFMHRCTRKTPRPKHSVAVLPIPKIVTSSGGPTFVPSSEKTGFVLLLRVHGRSGSRN